MRRAVAGLLLLATTVPAGFPVLSGLSSLPALAQGQITGGAPGITVNGKPVARQGDAVTGAPTTPGAPTQDTITGGSNNVFFNGRPAATVGSGTGCGGVVTGGATGVFINGKPLARQGDSVTGCPPR
jgi:uncharacterized Zn-binding protein involved in type VI secretion